MAKSLNNKIAEDIAYLKGKIDASEKNAEQHREWEVSQMNKIEGYLKDQNGRISSNEVAIGWFKGITAMFSLIVGYIFKRTL
jgi:hypothetical protein